MAKILIVIYIVEQQKVKNFGQGKCKNNKTISYVYKVYASTYNVEILNYFNPGLQLKNTEYAIRNRLKRIKRL